jgi:SPP1 gp7 family putative phage head morphogenesis protein
LFASLEASYHTEDCGCESCQSLIPEITALDFSVYDNLIDKIAQDLHDGKIQPSDLNQELIDQTYKDLAEGAAAGIGKSWTTQYKKDGEDSIVTELKKNLYTFASAKNFAQLETLNKMLYYQDGKLRPFNEFSQLAKGLNRQYNKHWLQAEHQTAKAAAQMAIKWQRFQRNKDLFPNLQYRTVGDAKVREAHAVLNGIIRPIDDPFWSTHYPPNGWRCRCDVVATAADKTAEKVSLQPTEEFVGNVGRDEVIFSTKHKYFMLLNTEVRAKINAELMKLNAPSELKYTNEKTGKTITANIFHDKKDFDANFESAKIIVDELKLNVEIRAHLIIGGYKNPEYLIKGKIGERKAPISKNYNNILSKANKQGCEVVVIDLSINNDTIENAEVQINNVLRFNVHENLKTVYIISSDKKTVKEYKRKKQP